MRALKFSININYSIISAAGKKRRKEIHQNKKRKKRSCLATEAQAANKIIITMLYSIFST